MAARRPDAPKQARAGAENRRKTPPGRCPKSVQDYNPLFSKALLRLNTGAMLV
jgi:hypothetical protein